MIVHHVCTFFFNFDADEFLVESDGCFEKNHPKLNLNMIMSVVSTSETSVNYYQSRRRNNP